MKTKLAIVGGRGSGEIVAQSAVRLDDGFEFIGYLDRLPRGVNYTNNGWPYLQLGYHLLDSDGGMLAFDNEKSPLSRSVEIEEVTVFFGFAALSAPGDYLLEWDMVSENERWFSECGSSVLRTPLRVL